MLCLAACGSEGGDTDAGTDGGFTLTDVDPGAESFRADPPEVRFERVATGEVDIHAVLVLNESTALLRITDLAIVRSAAQVTFANLFLGRVSERHGWRDRDADRQTFETRDGPITVIPGGQFEVLVQFGPDGGLLECPERPPAPCGHLEVSGESTVLAVPLFVPRGDG